MKKGTLRPPVKWHGGKHYMCGMTLSQFPTHQIYVELFGGAASLLLTKPPLDVEVYNDLSEELTNFLVLRDNGPELVQRLTLAPYSEIKFELACL